MAVEYICNFAWLPAKYELLLEFFLTGSRSRICCRLFNVTRRSKVRSRTFTASGAAVWNDLPAYVTAAPSLVVFRQRLKTFLFSRSYPIHCHLTYNLCIRLLYLCGYSNNFIIQATLEILMMPMMMMINYVFFQYILEGLRSYFVSDKTRN